MGSKTTEEYKKSRKLSVGKVTGFETSTSTGKGEKSYAESVDPAFGKKPEPVAEKASAPSGNKQTPPGSN